MKDVSSRQRGCILTTKCTKVKTQKGSVDEATEGFVTGWVSVLLRLQLPGGLLIYSEDEEVLVLV